MSTTENSRGPLTLKWTIQHAYRTRPIDHDPISGPSGGVEAFSGFVSNRNNSMMRCRLWCALCVHLALGCNLHIPAAWHGTRVYDESQIVNLKRGSDPSTGLGADNRMYYGPSAQRQIRFYCSQTLSITGPKTPLKQVLNSCIWQC